VVGKFFIPFLGTHDECQRWLENNSRLKELVEGNGMAIRAPSRQGSPSPGQARLPEGRQGMSKMRFCRKQLTMSCAKCFAAWWEGKNKTLDAKVALDEPCP
jgi:hypothetical protein